MEKYTRVHTSDHRCLNQGDGQKDTITRVSASITGNHRSVTIQRFCFTLNNYTEREYDNIWLALCGICTYAIVGREVGEAGTPHLQGFGNLGRKGRKTFAALKRILTDRAHIEIARGTDLDNTKYCSKSGEFVEYGSPQNPGKRNDRETVCQNIKLGKRVAEVAMEDPVQFHKGLEKLANIVSAQLRTAIHLHKDLHKNLIKICDRWCEVSKAKSPKRRYL